jgi:glycosyltransferase involved in cell wall biosynthesis
MNAIAVDIVMRSNFRETRGGDVSQIENSLAPLGDRVDVRYIAATAGMSLRYDAIHHIVNVDRPLDFLMALGHAGPKVVVSAVHHALPRIVAMQRAVGDDRKANFLPDFLRERLAFAGRASGGDAADLRPSSIARTLGIAFQPSNMWRRLGTSLNGVYRVALLSEQERADLMADTGWHGRNGVVIPNGVPVAAGVQIPWTARPRNIIVVGRVEPRKRQLAIALAAIESKTAVTFVGPANDDNYGNRFREVVAHHSFIEWLGPCSNAVTFGFMTSARVLLNASWVEVQSLVDIEAAAAGCWVTTSPTGSSSEWLGSVVDRIDSDDPQVLLARAQSRAIGQAAPPSFDYQHSWNAAGEKLLAIYADLEQVGK